MGTVKIWALHGAVGQAADWNDFAGRMQAAGHEVRAFDLWSFLEDGDYSLEEFARQLCSEARKEGDRPVLVGYSMGGRLALHAVLEETSAWKGAVVVSAHPGLQDEKERMLRMARDAEWAGKALAAPWRDFIEAWESQAVLQGRCACPPAERELLEERRVAVARGFTSWSLGKQDDLREKLAGLDLPLVWISGRKDRKFNSLAGELWPCMPEAFHLEVAESGHRVPWQAPREFASCVEHLLDLANR